MSEHIEQSKWLQIFSGESGQLMDFDTASHIATCSECRKLYESGKKLQAQLRMADISTGMDTNRESSAYQAVASAYVDKAKKKIDGCLSVDVGQYGDGFVFDIDSVYASGEALKYAMNFSEDKAEMLDDGEALKLTIHDNRLSVYLDPNEPDAVLICMIPGEPDVVERLNPEAVIAIPDVPVCSFVIDFEK